MTRRPLPLRFEPFIAKLEQASDEGDADFIARSMPRLEEVIADLMDWQDKLAFAQKHRPQAGRTRGRSTWPVCNGEVDDR